MDDGEELTLEFFSLRGLVVYVDTLDITLHLAYEELCNSAFRFCALSDC